MMVGGLFASLGMILASFSTSIIHIYLTTGVITGESLGPKPAKADILSLVAWSSNDALDIAPGNVAVCVK